MTHHDQVYLGYQLKKERFLAEQFTDVFDDLLDPEATQPSDLKVSKQSSPEELEAEFQSISRDVQILVNAVNESITTALETDDISARKREVAAARATITELQSVSARHPSVELERVEQVMVLIGKIDR